MLMYHGQVKGSGDKRQRSVTDCLLCATNCGHSWKHFSDWECQGQKLIQPLWLAGWCSEMRQSFHKLPTLTLGSSHPTTPPQPPE